MSYMNQLETLWAEPAFPECTECILLLRSLKCPTWTAVRVKSTSTSFGWSLCTRHAAVPAIVFTLAILEFEVIQHRTVQVVKTNGSMPFQSGECFNLWALAVVAAVSCFELGTSSAPVQNKWRFGCLSDQVCLDESLVEWWRCIQTKIILHNLHIIYLILLLLWQLRKKSQKKLCANLFQKQNQYGKTTTCDPAN